MRVHCLPADNGGWAANRIRLPAAAVADARPDWTITVGGDPPDQADLIVLHNAMWPEHPALIREVQAAGTAVIVDIDDDIDRVPVGNIAHGVSAGLHNYAWKQALQLADLVTCSTPPLRHYAPGRVMVLPNRVDEAWLELPRWDGPLRVGWSGGVAWHAGSLEVTGGAVGEVCAEVGAAFWLVGHPEGVRDALGLPGRVELTATGWVDYSGYPEQLRRCTVGIVPLPATPFAQAKSALKGLEFAALGVPFVYSMNHPEYRRLRLGVPAATPAGWRLLLSRLLTEPGWREQMSAELRRRAARLTYRRHAESWAVAWELAVIRRRRVGGRS